jgi:mono/diheme cytochrome c family protein
VYALFALILAGCGTPPSPNPTPTPATPPSAPAAANPAPTASAAPPESAPVGPDGPSSISVPNIEVSTDATVVAKGEQAFTKYGCGACHQFGSKLVGPDLVGVTARRTPTWIARMVAAPEVMTKQDPVAKDLFRTLMVQMTNQGVTPDELGPLVSYLKSKEK